MHDDLYRLPVGARVGEKDALLELRLEPIGLELPGLAIGQLHDHAATTFRAGGAHVRVEVEANGEGVAAGAAGWLAGGRDERIDPIQAVAGLAQAEPALMHQVPALDIAVMTHGEHR